MFQICLSALQDQHAAPVAAPSVLEFHSNGKQLDLPKLKVQLLNGKMPLLV
jgi:hypothetical protein